MADENDEIDEAGIKQRWERVGSKLDERGRRLWAASEVQAAGHGALKVVSRITGLARSTINRGEDDLDEGPLPDGRVRRKGGGGRPLSERDPTVVDDLKRLVEPATLGSPVQPLRWVSKSREKLAWALSEMGHKISANTVGKLLTDVLGFSRQVNRKADEGSHHPDRNAQFEHINGKVVAAQAKGEPVISVDTKKKELIGNYKNAGSDYRPQGQPTRVNVHDFPDKELGKAVPYGVYDVAANEAFVSVGITADTAEFAVAAIRTWLERMGRQRYPKMSELTITADCGGSNGARVRLWKVELQKLADETDLMLRVHHYPPGTSKWNRIEHRLFCHITQNWRGRPLTDRIAVVELIGATTTETGLKVECLLDERTYEKGIKVSAAEMASLDITGDAFHTAMERYNERFPDARALKRIAVTTEGENAFVEIKAQLIARSEYVAAQSRQYAEEKLSLAMLAHMTGGDPIDVMLGLSETGTPYRVATGLAQERSAAFRAIRANNAAGCVVDASPYHCIRRLGLEDVVVSVCGDIGITQATADLYRARLQSIGREKGSAGTMGYRDGKFYMTQRTEEQKESTRATIKSDLDWLTSNAEILPARPVQDPPPALRRLGSVKGARFFDGVYAANGSGRILLVDDLFTRQVAGMLGTPATWLQPALMVARDRKIISAEQYARAITDLADVGQEFISVDPPTLALSRKLDRESGEEGVGRRFKAATKVLGGKRADPVSHCSVAAVFLDALWSSSHLELGDRVVTSHLLRELLKYRTEDYQAILDALDQRLAHRTSFRIYLREWVRGHFLRWPQV